MLVSSIEAAETPMMNLVAVAVWETILDSIFLLETILRVISSPSKKAPGLGLVQFGAFV